MPVRESPLKPMTISGHCAWPTANYGHGFCTGKVCTCQCHQDLALQVRLDEIVRSTLKKSSPASEPKSTRPEPSTPTTENTASTPRLKLQKRRRK